MNTITILRAIAEGANNPALQAYRRPVAKTKFEAWKQGLTLDDLASEKSQSGSCDLCPIYPNVKDPMYPRCGRNSETCYRALTEWGNNDAYRKPN